MKWERIAPEKKYEKIEGISLSLSLTHIQAKDVMNKNKKSNLFDEYSRFRFIEHT